jgi:hypothetical protein
MALPGGSRPDAPKSVLQRLIEWLELVRLLAYIVTAGLARWLVQRITTMRTASRRTRVS